VNQDLAGLAFGAGLVAALNPCGFAMLPAYLALVIGEGTGRPPAVGRAIGATVAMTAGFLAVFGLFGVLTVEMAATVQGYLPYVTVVIGIMLVAVGIWLLLGRQLTIFVPNPLAHTGRWAPTARIGSMLGYGVSYAITSLSCTVGPFLAVTGASVRSGPVLQTVWVYLVYAGGFALVVGSLAIAAAFASSALTERVRSIVPFVNRISGALLVAVGCYIGYYGVYEVRISGRGANPADPVIIAAGRLQGTVEGWVYRNGAWPWLVALAVLMLGALAWIWRARARRKHQIGACGDIKMMSP
jgi:cytochrome c biogenesis protein CcdA